MQYPDSHQGSAGEVARAFGILGLTAFGGPTAHLGYFREEFVTRRRWLSDSHYSYIVALCQFLPGPASSQVGMALGFHRAGYLGMFLAWLMFTAPSAIALVVFALALGHFSIDPHTGWLQGLLAAAVGVVAHAVWSMGKNMVTSVATAVIAVASFATVLLVSSPWIQVATIAAAGLATALLIRNPEPAKDTHTDGGFRSPSKNVATLALAAFGALLIGAIAAGYFAWPWLVERAASYIYAGSLVFGGGHVVLPMLETHLVPNAVDASTFLAGYSAAQAVPGPLFTFASFLGAAEAGLMGALLATVAIFLPAALLTIAGLYFYAAWMGNALFRRALIGVNAAVVGILAATLWDPVITHGIVLHKDGMVQHLVAAGIAVAAWLGLDRFKLAPWMIALGSALIGALAL